MSFRRVFVSLLSLAFIGYVALFFAPIFSAKFSWANELIAGRNSVLAFFIFMGAISVLSLIDSRSLLVARLEAREEEMVLREVPSSVKPLASRWLHRGIRGVAWYRIVVSVLSLTFSLSAIAYLLITRK